MTTRSRTRHPAPGCLRDDRDEHGDPQREREPAHGVEVGRGPFDDAVERVAPTQQVDREGDERRAVGIDEAREEADAGACRAAVARVRPTAGDRRASVRRGGGPGRRSRARTCRARSPRARRSPAARSSDAGRPTSPAPRRPRATRRATARRAAAVARTTACRGRPARRPSPRAARTRSRASRSARRNASTVIADADEPADETDAERATEPVEAGVHRPRRATTARSIRGPAR